MGSNLPATKGIDLNTHDILRFKECLPCPIWCGCTGEVEHAGGEHLKGNGGVHRLFLSEYYLVSNLYYPAFSTRFCRSSCG